DLLRGVFELGQERRDGAACLFDGEGNVICAGHRDLPLGRGWTETKTAIARSGRSPLLLATEVFQRETSRGSCRRAGRSGWDSAERTGSGAALSAAKRHGWRRSLQSERLRRRAADRTVEEFRQCCRCRQ